MSQQVVTITKDRALKAYHSASSEGRALLSDLIDYSALNLPITERVKDFNDILAIKGITMDQLIVDSDTSDEIAYKQVKIIAEVYNEGTVLDPNDTEQYKYYPWFEITPGSGVGLSYHYCDNWISRSGVGVRLCFKSRELAIDAGKKFTDIYANLLIK